MKTVQQMPTAFDRMSTHEELHQVLALVSEGAAYLVPEAQSEADEKRALQEAVADLWTDTAADERDVDSAQEDSYHWAHILAGEARRLN